MNKADLVNGMAEGAGITKAAANKALNALLKDIEGALQKWDTVTLVGFGTWSVARRAARKGRSPRPPHDVIQIKAKNVVKFKPGLDLSNAVN